MSTITDYQAHAILLRMADHMTDWADSRAFEPSDEEASGECMRFILAEVVKLEGEHHDLH